MTKSIEISTRQCTPRPVYVCRCRLGEPGFGGEPLAGVHLHINDLGLVKRDAVVAHLAVFHKSILLPFKISHGTFVLAHSFREVQLPQWPNRH